MLVVSFGSFCLFEQDVLSYYEQERHSEGTTVREAGQFDSAIHSAKRLG